MKSTFLTILCSMAFLTTFSQAFYKSFKDADYQKLSKDGFSFIKTGNNELDVAYSNALEKYWKFSKYNVIDINEETPNDNDIVMIEMNVGNYTSALVLIKYGEILKENTRTTSTIGFINFDGFDEDIEDKTKLIFVDQMIIGLNQTASLITENEISKAGVPLYSELYDLILPNIKSLNGKTLLIVGGNKAKVHEKGIKASGIKYEYISLKEYEILIENNMGEYCLFYCTVNNQTDFSIYDFESNQMIYFKHFMNYKGMMSKPEFSKIVKNW